MNIKFFLKEDTMGHESNNDKRNIYILIEIEYLGTNWSCGPSPPPKSRVANHFKWLYCNKLFTFQSKSKSRFKYKFKYSLFLLLSLFLSLSLSVSSCIRISLFLILSFYLPFSPRSHPFPSRFHSQRYYVLLYKEIKQMAVLSKSLH